MINEIILDMISDYVQIEFDRLTEKDVLFKNGIIDMAAPELSSAWRNSRESGARLRMPGFEIEQTPWQNVLTPPVAPNTVAATPGTPTTYTAVGLTMVDEYGIQVYRRKLFEYSSFNDKLRVWGKKALVEIARQLARDAVRSGFDLSMHMVMRGAIPNLYDETVTNFLGRVAGVRTLEPRVINQAKQTIGDNRDTLRIMITHSKCWTDLIDVAYSAYANATLLSTDQLATSEGVNVWLANGMIVYVTDKCYVNSDDTEGASYDTYLLAPRQLQLLISEPYNLVADPPLAIHETRYVRAGIDFIPHLKGMEYLAASPAKPTNLQLSTAANWALGRYPNANMVQAVTLRTN